MSTDRLHLDLGSRSYDILIAAELLAARACPALEQAVAGRRLFVVTDSNVGPLYADSLAALLVHNGGEVLATEVFPAGEPAKNLRTLARFYDAAVDAGVDRQSLVVALGGGVTGDMAGFLAATYMRGIDYIQAPT